MSILSVMEISRTELHIVRLVFSRNSRVGEGTGSCTSDSTQKSPPLGGPGWPRKPRGICRAEKSPRPPASAIAMAAWRFTRIRAGRRWPCGGKVSQSAPEKMALLVPNPLDQSKGTVRSAQTERPRKHPAASEAQRTLLNGKANLSGDMALRIEKAFSVKIDTFMRMQSNTTPLEIIGLSVKTRYCSRGPFG